MSNQKVIEEWRKVIEGDKKLESELENMKEKPLTKDVAHQKVLDFITQRGYTYTVERVISSYLEYYKKGYYISYTMKDCVKHLENELEILTNE